MSAAFEYTSNDVREYEFRSKHLLDIRMTYHKNSMCPTEEDMYPNV